MTAFDPFRHPHEGGGGDAGGFVTLVELYRRHKLVALGHRMGAGHGRGAVPPRRLGAQEHPQRRDRVPGRARGTSGAGCGGHRRCHCQYCCPARRRQPLRPRQPVPPRVEYARAGDGTTYLDEDHSLANNLYRHPDRWGRPAARLDKAHDVYALGVVLLEIALWKDVGTVLRAATTTCHRAVVPVEVAEALALKCRRTLPHQVGDVFAQCILACLEFGARTKGLDEYEAQVYFQEKVVRLIKKAVRRVLVDKIQNWPVRPNGCTCPCA